MQTSKKKTNTTTPKKRRTTSKGFDTDGQVSDSIIAITVMAQHQLMDILLYPYGIVGEQKIKFYGRKRNWFVSICRGGGTRKALV